MAEKFPETKNVVIDPVEVEIDKCFDELVSTVNKRREALLEKYREKREEIRARETGRGRTRQQLLETRAHLQERMVENTLQSLREKMAEEIETQLRELEVTDRPVELLFQCDTRAVEETIYQLGQFIQKEDTSIPNYPALTQPRISICTEGTGPGQLYWPYGIAHNEVSHLIYVADCSFVSGGRVCVFTEEGEYVNSFGHGKLCAPMGIAVSSDNLYVGDYSKCTVVHYKLPGNRLVSKVGKKGSGKNEFSRPQNISVSTNGDVYIADNGNNRVVVRDSELKFKQSIQHSSMTQPYDVKTLNNEVYVLSEIDNPCLHLFHQSGSKLRSFITCGEGSCYQIGEGFCFCFDKQSNLLIGDYRARCIKVFSRAGTLLHTLSGSKKENTEIQPRGIVVTPNNQIVCSSVDTKFKLHLY